MQPVDCMERRFILRCLGVFEVLTGLAVVCINLLVIYMIPYMDFAIVHSAIFFLCLLSIISGMIAIMATRPIAPPSTVSTCLAMHTVAAVITLIELLFLICLLIFSHGSLSLAHYMIALIKKDHEPDGSQEKVLSAFYLTISVSLVVEGVVLMTSAVLAFYVLQAKNDKGSRSDNAEVRLLGGEQYYSVAPPTRLCPKTDEAALVPMA